MTYKLLCLLLTIAGISFASCNDDEAATDGVLVRVVNNTSATISNISMGFIIDDLQSLGQTELAPGASSEFLTYPSGGACDFKIRFQDSAEVDQSTFTACRCWCPLDAGEHEAVLRQESNSTGYGISVDGI